jgi:hypothetical protein
MLGKDGSVWVQRPNPLATCLALRRSAGDKLSRRQTHELGHYLSPRQTGARRVDSVGYALRVGEIDALVISDGTMSIPASVLAVNAAPAALEAWLHGMFLPARFGWSLNVGVARSGGRTVLIDAGSGRSTRSLQGRVS